MKVISTTGYYGTGSSAVTDYLMEFDNIQGFGDFEFKFIQDPFGVSDLEYYLVENNHRHNSGFALKKFKQMVDTLYKEDRYRWYANYEKYFNGNFKRISYEYIEALTECKYKGFYHYDEYDKGDEYYKRFAIERRKKVIKYWIKKILYFDLLGKHKLKFQIPNLLTEEMTYVCNPGAEFYPITRKYTTALFESVSNNEFIMFDQLVPSSNIERYAKYFDNISIIVVDRDPIDLYISERELWHESVIPSSLQEFIIWYESIRRHQSQEQELEKICLKIQFEDFIYKYDTVASKINDFLGLDSKNQINAKKYFNPELSINNINLLSKFPQYEHDANIIKEKLSKYCYNFNGGVNEKA